MSGLNKQKRKYTCKFLKNKATRIKPLQYIAIKCKLNYNDSEKCKKMKGEKKMLLRDIVQAKRYAFFDGADDWRDAIRKSCGPLVETGCATREYEERVIECVEVFGPYIVIVPGLAIPHAAKDAPGIAQTAIAFAKFERPVRFDEADREKDASVFFALTAVNEDEHIKNMRQLFKLLSNEELLERLAHVRNERELLVLDAELC